MRSSLSQNSGARNTTHRTAAEIKENDKKKDDAKKLRSLQLTERNVDYIKTPLVYEKRLEGFGKEAKKWFKKVQLEFRKNNGDSFGTLGGLGYDHTWSANSFTQWWTQRFAMTLNRSHVVACAWQAGFTPGTGGAARLGTQSPEPGGLIAGGNVSAQSPLSGRREQARTEGLAPPPAWWSLRTSLRRG